MKKAIRISIGALLLAACGGSADTTICDLASQHVAACLSQAMPQTSVASCDGRNIDLAGQLLALDCSGIQSLQTNTGTVGKADEGACLAPWDCPDKYPMVDDTCGIYDMAKCQIYCDQLFADDHLRLRKVTCEVLEGGTAHCQCKGYWLPWPESSPSEEPSEEPSDEPADDESDDDDPAEDNYLPEE